jgi:hypothetical protein
MLDINNLKGRKIYFSHGFRGLSPSERGGCARTGHTMVYRKQCRAVTACCYTRVTYFIQAGLASPVLPLSNALLRF